MEFDPLSGSAPNPNIKPTALWGGQWVPSNYYKFSQDLITGKRQDDKQLTDGIKFKETTGVSQEPWALPDRR